MKIIQVSDLHLANPGELLFGSDPLVRLDACLADVVRRHADADLVVITGDLTNDGEIVAYRALRERLAQLNTPTRLLIGNHDVRPAFREIFPQVPVDDAGFIQSALATKHGRMLFLDTHEPGTHEGRYCAQRLAWLKARLDEARNEPVYIFMHHPPMKLALPPMDLIRLREADALRALLAKHGGVKHIFFGHVHRPVSGSWHGIPYSAIKGTNHQVLLDFGGSTKIRISAEPPSYAVIFIDEDGVTVHVHDFLHPEAQDQVGTIEAV